MRLVFTSDGVEVAVVITSVELYDLVKKCSDSAYNSFVYNQVKTGLSESQAEVEELNQSQSVGTCIVIGLSDSPATENQPLAKRTKTTHIENYSAFKDSSSVGGHNFVISLSQDC